MDTKSHSENFIYTDWKLIETQFDPTQLQARETLFTIGNGYLGTRGCFEEGYPQSLPATFIHGVYDDVPIVYKELVNCPDWLPFAIIFNESSLEEHEQREGLRLDQGEIIEYQRQLDIHEGVLSRSLLWRSPSGKTIKVQFERFASLADIHVLVQRCQITPVDFEGIIEVQTSINGYADNQGFNHWGEIDQGKINQGFWLHSRTRTSRIDICMAAKMKIIGTQATTEISTTPGYPSWSATFNAKSQQTVTIEKTITVFTSLETEKPILAAQAKLIEQPDYQTLLLAQAKAWNQVWLKNDVLIDGDSTAAFAVRYNLFQLLIAAPKEGAQEAGNKGKTAVSIPAKTLSGFGYHGHIFWDTEIFILPLLIFTQPDIARNLLSYRYQTLDGARRKASHYGYLGAMFSWESADTGDEVTPRWSLPNDFYGEDVRIWCRDREIHINADIAYAVWYYWWVTKDDQWMQQQGAEIILDTAIFWTTRVEFNPDDQRYEIRGVIGADEYHECVNNNSFTNCMVKWHLIKALWVYDWLCNHFPEQATFLAEKLQLTAEIRHQWSEISQKIWILFSPETGLIEQFEGFFQLQDINLAADYEPRNKSMQAILGVEQTNKFQVLKQLDVLMLIYLMRQPSDFPYNEQTLRVNWDYYAPRTDMTYGSSLSPSLHAALAADLNLYPEAYELFMQGAMVDLEDRRNNTGDGIHGACAGGVWQAVVFGFAGIRLTENGPVAHPRLPPHWKKLKFQLYWRGEYHQFDLGQNSQLPNPDIQGVIFDLDGVLTDTAELHYLAWKKLADEEGIPFDRQANEALRGVSRRNSLMLILGERKYSETKIQQLMQKKNDYYLQFIQSVTPKNLLPGADALLQELVQAGIKIAIGSGSKNARIVIDRLHIGDKLDAIADGNSVNQAKPAPDLFLYAAHLLGIPQNQCVVFEDATVGIEAAKAGGMWSVGIGSETRVGAATVVVPNLARVTWGDIKGKIQRIADSS